MKKKEEKNTNTHTNMNYYVDVNEQRLKRLKRYLVIVKTKKRK